jgi:peroxiredoxin family protein
LIGLLSSALLIAILAKKLLLTREEKYVHTFVLNTQIAKERKNQAANVIKFAMKTWYLKRQDKSTSIQNFQAQRKLFRSIHYLQQIKQEQRNLVDNCVGLSELMTIHRNTSVQTEGTVEQIAAIKTEVKKIKEKLNNMNRSMDTLQNTLNVLLDKVAK